MQLIFELAFLPSCCVLEKRMLIFNICFIHTHMLYWKVYIGRQTCFLVPLPHLCPASQVCHRAWYCCFCFYIHRGLRLSCHFSPSLVDWFRSISLFQVWYLAKKKKNHQKTDSKHMLEISGVRVTLRWNFFQVKISFRIKHTSVKIWQLKKKCWEFPGSPVVRTWRFQDWRAWAQSLAQEIRSCKPCSMAKKKKKKTLWIYGLKT